MQINLKKLDIVMCYKVEENFYIKRITKKLFLTMTPTSSERNTQRIIKRIIKE